MPAMQITELFLMRHGETDWNRVRRVQGHVDKPLNDRGIEQARAALGAVQALHRQRPFTALWVSDLGRAQETAHYASHPIALPKTIDPIWRERNFGVLESMTHDEMMQTRATEYEGWKSGLPDFQIPDGESLRQFSERIQAALEVVFRQHQGERVLVVTHGGAIDMARRIIEQEPLSAPRGYEIPNCSLSCIREQQGQRSLGPWIQAEHLQGLV
jgi:2,3-bisphosphoglycerate-dependent phosphoglycerate mutase